MKMYCVIDENGKVIAVTSNRYFAMKYQSSNDNSEIRVYNDEIYERGLKIYTFKLNLKTNELSKVGVHRWEPLEGVNRVWRELNELYLALPAKHIKDLEDKVICRFKTYKKNHNLS